MTGTMGLSTGLAAWADMLPGPVLEIVVWASVATGTVAGTGAILAIEMTRTSGRRQV